MSIDWENGVWQTGRRGSGTKRRITIASDWAPIRDYEQRILANPAGIYGDLLPILQASDLRVVNVESVLGQVGDPIPKAGPNLRGSDKAVQSLKEVPFDVACLANNHTMDFGPESLALTENVLQSAGLQTVGAGQSGEDAVKPLIVSVGDLDVGIIDCAEGEECRSVNGGPGVYGLDVQAAAAQVDRLQSQVDVVLVIFHGGREHAPVPPPYVVRDLRTIAAAGATAVIAHHPHVPQGLEIYRHVPIAYSLGNFVFWQNSDLFFRRCGYLVHLDFEGKDLVEMKLTPYLIDPVGLRLMPSATRALFLKDLQHVSDLLNDFNGIESAWDAFVDRMGLEGLARQLELGAQNLRTDPVKAAAQVKNMFFTPAHRELFINGMGRATRNELGQAPEWAHRLVERWLTLPYDEQVQHDEQAG